MEKGIVNQNWKLDKQGILGCNCVMYNLTEPSLMQESIKRGEGQLGSGGTLLVSTGKHTGRSPRDKFFVREKSSEDRIWWENSAEISEDNFSQLYDDVLAHMMGKDYYVQDLFGCADKKYRIKVRSINELAWHALFIRHLLRRPEKNEVLEFIPEFTMINCPSFKAVPEKHGCRSDTIIAISIERRVIIISGTQYAGENKKAVFTLLNYLLPEKGVMPMHCSANQSRTEGKEPAVFFGLSGTGKTTLSQDPERILIGDDEHGWSDSGIFNFEGGCYAKTINLSRDSEPEIYSTTTKFATVIENMIFDHETLALDYSDDSITPNTRCAYPLNYISNSSRSGVSGQPSNVVLLTCDAFGVFPPVAQLTCDQAIYHFLSGFTSKAAGTETGIIEPQPTFSACFGAPFLPLKPEIYGKLLKEKILKSGSKCWLVNTGWTGGAYGVGKRMPIKDTRAILSAILSNSIEEADFKIDNNFGFKVPQHIEGVNQTLLNPRSTWNDESQYDKQSLKLLRMFSKNFGKFDHKKIECESAILKIK